MSTFANSEDPDEMQHNAAFHQGLHCLKRFKGSSDKKKIFENHNLRPRYVQWTIPSLFVLLLWIFYVFVLSYVCYVFVRVCLYVPCGHLLGKG